MSDKPDSRPRCHHGTVFPEDWCLECMRERAEKAEAENARLLKVVGAALDWHHTGGAKQVKKLDSAVFEYEKALAESKDAKPPSGA